jgi:Na+-translocating ferredoxin:NAD+ oxidoreductase RNF subunit RnfB
LKAKYSDLFKKIVNSYYDGGFEKKLETILSDPEVNKEDLAQVISSLCGVQLDFTKDYIADLKKAIKDYEINHKVVNKVKVCSMDCVDIDGKTMCQKSCPFDAIIIDENNNTVKRMIWILKFIICIRRIKLW